ncbi:TPA: hypothetical protein N0F65_000816 [Lagenidium giganteum]|uniref:Uncharacterized protein n=1 Tax=Lagenidium giganteum TaxID=4803 RepID=A0AAV2YYH2_9STRA|nr:TPA: hypothetical protein N0F65_000816 [Lagenidium giganteum]
MMLANMAQKGSKDSRASEALAMKDEQMRILGEQNAHLLTSLNAMDDEIATLKLHKLQLEEENRSLRDSNFELQSKARAAETNMKKAQTGMEERDTQVRVLTDHNTELLRLLEHEESQSASLSRDVTALKAELDALQTRYNSLLATAKMHEEIATRATREGQLRAEEVRLLRNENDQLRACNTELKMKTQVEVEALQEQLRVRKEKQYQLLEKLQQLEEVKRQSDDQLNALEEKLRKFHERNQELETQLQLESKAKRAQIDANKNFFIENGNLMKDKQELQQRFEKAEQERTRMEAENRDSAEQLREMAEKVFQLLERLKLAELGKTKAIDALKQKELELLALKKKNSRLLKEGTKEGKARVKSELDKKVLLEQIQALKKHNAQLSIRCSEEVKAKLKEAEERKALEEKIKTMSSRVAFLLNKMQADEEAKIVTKEETKKMHAQLTSMQDKNAELTAKLHATAESNRVVTEALRCKQDELDALGIKMEALQRKMTELTLAMENSGVTIGSDNQDGHKHHGGNNQVQDGNSPEDIAAAANGRFFVEARASHGGLLVIKARRGKYSPEAIQAAIDFIERLGINAFLKRAQKSMNTKQMLVEKLAVLMSQVMSAEDVVDEVRRTLLAKDEQLGHLARKTVLVQEKLTLEEDAKRKTLLRYVHEIKARSLLAATVAAGPGAEDQGILKLPESGVGDEEVHAIAALLRNAPNVKELQLRGNAITSEGARAIAAVLSNPACHLRMVDLRLNRIGPDGIKVLAEALERHERVKHVYVHAGGKVEALGTTTAAINAHVLSTGVGHVTGASSGLIGVETLCVVDVREQVNAPAEMELALVDDLDAPTGGSNGTPKHKLALSAMASSPAPSTDKDKTVLFSRRPISALALDKKLARKKKLDEMRRNAKKEAEWSGRAGGMDLAPSPAAHKKLPPIGPSGGGSNSSTSTSTAGANGSASSAINRSSSAPSIKKGDEPSHDERTS